jgi:head-tail adaptor
MLGAGQRAFRVRFERMPRGADDGAGNVQRLPWVGLVTCWAGFKPQFGREQLAAGRLESMMKGVLTVLAFAETRSVTAEDRVVFVTGPYAGKECQIRSIVPTPDAREIEFTLEHGVAT